MKKGSLKSKGKAAVTIFYYSIGLVVYIVGFLKRLLHNPDHSSKWLERKQDEETVSSAGRQY